jgi:hypothetical protein
MFKNYNENYDTITDFDVHWENSVGTEWVGDYHKASSTIDETWWNEDDPDSSKGSNKSRSDMECPTSTNEQANGLPWVSANNQAPHKVVFNPEPNAADIEDTGPKTSHRSSRLQKALSNICKELFCLDCKLVIRTDCILKCSEPSCTENVCSTLTTHPWKHIDILHLYSTILPAEDL